MPVYCLLCSKAYEPGWTQDSPTLPLFDIEGIDCSVVCKGNDRLSGGYYSKYDCDKFSIPDLHLRQQCNDNKGRMICNDCIALKLQQGKIQFHHTDGGGIGSYPLSYHDQYWRDICPKCTTCQQPNYYGTEWLAVNNPKKNKCHQCCGATLRL